MFIQSLFLSAIYAISVLAYWTGAVTDKSQPRHKKYTQFYREEGVFFGIIYV